MELVSGQTIQEIVHERSLDLKTILQLSIQMADALEEAHSKGIIHRDIKPGNIMVTERGQVKILDFGLAKMDVPVEGDIHTLSTQSRTESGVLIGTVQYMSPEQALGQKLDRRTDLFSLGAVIYEMAAGRRAFSGESAASTLLQILQSQPESILRYNPSLPNELERIVMKCLRKKPAERYQTAADLQSDLQVLLNQHYGETGVLATSASLNEYVLPRNLARALFVVLQCVYIVMYFAALRWADGMEKGLVHVLGDWGNQVSLLYLLIPTIGIAVRLYLLTSVVWDHVQTGVRYRIAFPFYFLLDELWTLAPFGLTPRLGEFFALACVPALVFSPFAQRTLIRSAYDFHEPRRTSTNPDKHS
jgi:hypothetical protein